MIFFGLASLQHAISQFASIAAAPVRGVFMVTPS
jgi:hypothetical protein